MARSTLAERYDIRQSYLTALTEQLPAGVRPHLSITLMTDPFCLRVTARVKAENRDMLEFDVTEGKFSQNDLAMICLLA